MFSLPPQHGEVRWKVTQQKALNEPAAERRLDEPTADAPRSLLRLSTDVKNRTFRSRPCVVTLISRED